jgi:hypothetical protein
VWFSTAEGGGEYHAAGRRSNASAQQPITTPSDPMGTHWKARSWVDPELLSLSTFGVVDSGSDKERIARKTSKGARCSKHTAAEAAKQTRIMRKISREG